MAQTVRDGNQVRSSLGSYNGVPTRLLAEHATGYLKAKIVPTTLSAPSVNITRAKRDDNSVTSATGSFNGTVKPLLATNTGGYLRAVNS